MIIKAISAIAERVRMNFGFLFILFLALKDSNNPTIMANTI